MDDSDAPDLLAALRGMGPIGLRVLICASRASRALAGAVARLGARAGLPHGPIARWALDTLAASSLSLDAARFEIWRRASKFPRPGFSRFLPEPAALGSTARIAMGEGRARWSDLDLRVDWLCLLSLEAQRLAAFEPRLLHRMARAALASMPMLARHGEPGRHFEAELDARAPLWRGGPNPENERVILKLRPSRAFAPGPREREARLLAAEAFGGDEARRAEALARGAIARARDSSRSSGPL